MIGVPYSWWRGGMVPNHDFACVETLIQIQRFNRFPCAQMANAFVICFVVAVTVTVQSRAGS